MSEFSLRARALLEMLVVPIGIAATGNSRSCGSICDVLKLRKIIVAVFILIVSGLRFKFTHFVEHSSPRQWQKGCWWFAGLQVKLLLISGKNQINIGYLLVISSYQIQNKLYSGI